MNSILIDQYNTKLKNQLDLNNFFYDFSLN